MITDMWWFALAEKAEPPFVVTRQPYGFVIYGVNTAIAAGYQWYVLHVETDAPPTEEELALAMNLVELKCGGAA